MDALIIPILILGILALGQIFVGLKYLYTLKSVEKAIRECSHPIFTEDITRMGTVYAIEKKVNKILEEMMKGNEPTLKDLLPKKNESV